MKLFIRKSVEMSFIISGLTWGNGQTKSDVPPDIFSQGRENPSARGAKIP